MRFRVSGFRSWVAGVFGALVILLMLTSGCNMVWRKILFDPEKNQVIRVEKGERIYFDLKEDVDAGCRWDFTCDDADVEVTLDHEPPDGGDEGRELGTAEVRIRIHRGYDGPSAVRFFYKSPGKPIEKEFTITLYRRIGDYAFWE